MFQGLSMYFIVKRLHAISLTLLTKYTSITKNASPTKATQFTKDTPIAKATLLSKAAQISKTTPCTKSASYSKFAPLTKGAIISEITFFWEFSNCCIITARAYQPPLFISLECF